MKLGALRRLIDGIFMEHGNTIAAELDVTVRAVSEDEDGNEHLFIGTIDKFETAHACGDGELYVAADCSDEGVDPGEETLEPTTPELAAKLLEHVYRQGQATPLAAHPQPPQQTPLERRFIQNLHLDQGPPPPGMSDLLERNLEKLSVRLAVALARDNFPDTLEAASTLTSVGLIGLRDMGVPLLNAHELVDMTYAKGTLVQATDDQLARAGLTPPAETRDYCICGLRLPRHMAEVAPKRITFTHRCSCTRCWRWHHDEKTWTQQSPS